MRGSSRDLAACQEDFNIPLFLDSDININVAVTKKKGENFCRRETSWNEKQTSHNKSKIPTVTIKINKWTKLPSYKIGAVRWFLKL